MVSNNFFKSDLNRIHNIVQNTMTLYPKELIIATLRDIFSKGGFYRYVKDQWGYPQTPDQTDMPLGSGINDDLTTRLYIGESSRMTVQFYPSIIIRSGGSSSVPISFNAEYGSVKWGKMVFDDGYGNLKTFRTPEAFLFSGAWEGSLNIEISARDLRTRDDLVDLISILFVPSNIVFHSLVKEGIIVKGVSSGAATDSELDRNDRLFKQTITLQIRSEWYREIPIFNVIEIITTSIDFGRVDTPDPIYSPNLRITNSQTLLEILANL